MPESIDRSLVPTTDLQGDAWAAWNASYHESQPEAYRALGHALYRQAWHERISARLAQLDEQNELLDKLLAAGRTQRRQPRLSRSNH